MNKQEALKRIEVQKETLIRLTGWAVYVYIEELIKSLDEPQPVKVPQFVADWIEYCKVKKITLAHALYRSEEAENKNVFSWIVKDSGNQETFARAWLDGYEVEKEKRYLVKIKATKHYLVKDGNGKIFFSLAFKGYFTKKELEEAGFGWVFDCPGIEIEEVE